MTLPYLTINTISRSTLRIFREPTEDDGLLEEHIDIGGDEVIPKPRGSTAPPELHHRFLLLDSNGEVMKTFKCIRAYTEEGQNGKLIAKAKYVEVLDDSHLDKIEMQISTLRDIVDAIPRIETITIGKLSQAYSNATGNGARYKLLFSDTGNNWVDGTITLDTGTYELILIPKLTNVPESSNNFYVAIDMTATSAKGTPATTEEMWKDQDKLVGSTGNENKTAIPYFLTLTEETSLEFFIKVTGGGSNVVGVDENTRVLIKRIA